MIHLLICFYVFTPWLSMVICATFLSEISQCVHIIVVRSYFLSFHPNNSHYQKHRAFEIYLRNTFWANFQRKHQISSFKLYCWLTTIYMLWICFSNILIKLQHVYLFYFYCFCLKLSAFYQWINNFHIFFLFF